MADATTSVERHYGRGEILDSIFQALARMGKDTSQLTPDDLAAVDAFHLRGREATVELAGRASLEPGLRVLDVGCGIGGSARYLASQHGCRATGIDLTREYVEAARSLAERVGLGALVDFHQGSALDLPFEDAAFDVVWTEHVQMNIPDKRAFYGEIARVLRPGGRLVFHDIFRGTGGEPYYPVPWAEVPSLSFLAPPEAARSAIEAAGLRILDWQDKSSQSLDWLTGVIERIRQSGPPPLGIHLLMGDTARTKVENVARNLADGRIMVVQGVAARA